MTGGREDSRSGQSPRLAVRANRFGRLGVVSVDEEEIRGAQAKTLIDRGRVSGDRDLMALL
jgi:hypothetical protein